MKSFVILILIIIFSLTAFAQKPKTAKNMPNAAPKPKIAEPAINIGNEKEEFEKAVAVADASERIAALQKFIENFPKSAEKPRAHELIVSARAAIGDEKLRLNETAEGIEFFKLAVKDAPQPMSEKMGELILNFPTNLFWRGQRGEALEIAQLIEAKADGNAKQLLGLATFYLGTENASEAKRLAEKAIALDVNLPSAYQTLGLAFRLNFQLEESANAYAQALELDANSLVSRRSLAEMKRAAGKPDEAAALYREILEKDSADMAAQTGLVLSLFGAEKRSEAEAAMSKTLEANPNNLVLLVGAAYWYAAHNESAKAVEMAQKAVEIEPRYTWAHIALARGYLQQNRPLDAERALLTARQYGNFPTLDYEIASARMQAGFFREAAEILKSNFKISGENIKTNLGGRVAKEAANFTDLLALERRAGIFEPTAADNAENADKLKALLSLSQKLDAANEEEIASAADEFVKGDDKMRFYRGLFAANLLLQNKKALPKALELAQSAVGKTDAALDTPNASAAVLADELYESRTASMSRNQFIIVPNIPRQTLSMILRGRVEEITGWTFYQQNNPAQAAVHLKRAVSVLPNKSAWWRSSMWRLGAALEADGKEKDALDSYIKSYPADAPDNLKYGLIESLYKKVNGNADGLEAKIGAKPASAGAVLTETQTPAKVETIAQNTEAVNQPTLPNSETVLPKPESSPAIEAKSEIISTPEVKVETTPTAETTLENKPEDTPETTAKIESLKVERNEEKAPPTETLPATEVSTQITNPTPETALQTEEKPEAKPEEKSVINSEAITENPLPAEIPNPVNENKTEDKVLPNPEVSPVPETISEMETETNESTPTAIKPNEATDLKVSETTETAVSSAAKPKPLFEPIIITIPNTELLRNPRPKTSNVNSTSKTNETPDKSAEVGGLTRRRVVEIPAACSITVSQENVSLMNDGGSLGILVGFEKSGDAEEIKAVSSSPKDIEVLLEPDLGTLSGRTFFVVKSISNKIGQYTVSFEASCGRKEILVKVK